MADSAAKHGVQQFVYSSVERGGRDWSTDIPHFASKAHIEEYIKNTSLNWTYVARRYLSFVLMHRCVSDIQFLETCLLYGEVSSLSSQPLLTFC